MRVITRGPHFGYVSIQEVADLDTFINDHTLRVRWAWLDYEGNYFIQRVDGKKRVSLYVEGIEENRALLEARCLLPRRGSMKACCITAREDTLVSSAGTDSRIRTGQGLWYMLEPTLDPRYPALLAEVEAARKVEQRRLALIEEQEEALKSEIDDLVETIGYEEALRILKGPTTCKTQQS